jgi:shikimate kinase
MPSDIILIGPIGTGKTTLAKLLSVRLSLPYYSLDEKRWEYYQEVGYDPIRETQIDQEEGLPGVFRYWKRFDLHAIQRLLQEFHNGIFDFGGMASLFDEAEEFTRLKALLEPYKNVILLLPSPDLEVSKEALRKRISLGNTCPFDGRIDGFDYQEYMVKHPSNYALAKFKVYTQNRTPEETAEEILNL